MVHSSRQYIPPVIKGVTIHPDNPFHFDFIIDKGNASIDGTAFHDESLRLIKYFLASLAVPDEDLWVNLSPYEADRIIPEKFGRTEMGRDLLAQDYLLKQFTASLMYPEDNLGAEFWRRVHRKAQARFGTTDIPVSTFNKVWIVPDKAVIHEHGNSAFVAESRLKVMLEEDYLALENNKAGEAEFAQTGQQDAYRDHRHAITHEIIREVLIPEIEREVNEGEHFARLRQIYHSLLLATWYKEGMRQSILNQVYSNRNKIDGVEIADEQTKEDIYNAYVKAFQVGVYNYVREEFDADIGEVIPRKYFSGGMNIKPRITTVRNPSAVRRTGDMAILSTQFDVINREIRSPTDAAVLANGDEARMERGQRLKAVEKVFINQFSLLTGSLVSLMSMYVQTFGWQSEDSIRAFDELQEAVRTENLRRMFVLDKTLDLGMAHAPITDRFERFRQLITVNLGLLRSEVQAHEEERSVQLLIKMIDETVQFLERVFDRKLRFRAVDIAAEVRDYAEEFENTFNIPIEVRTPKENIGGIRIDRLRMAEVFYILFNNAREAGGNISVTVELSADQNDVLLHVADDGEGIAPEVLPRIFDPGFTTRATTEGQARGIGLNLAKLIVEMHGGRVDVTSEVGQGTTFTLTVPRRVRGPVLTRMVLDVAREMQAQVPEYQGTRGDMRRKLMATRQELFQGDKDHFIAVGIVPDAENESRATFDLRNRSPHIGLFEGLDEGGVTPGANDRVVRLILMYDRDGTLARVGIDPPNHIIQNRTGLPEIQEDQMGLDLMILSARFLTGYDSESGLFNQQRTVSPETAVLFRDAPVAGVTTIGDLAQRDTKIIGSDKAVLVNPYMAEAWEYLWERRQNLLNQNQLSKELGRNRGYINHLSKGRDIPGQELFEQILNVLQVPVEDRPEAQRLLDIARANRSNVPQSFVDLGKVLRDLRRKANAYVFVVERARVKTETRADIAKATGLGLSTLESLFIGAQILDDAAFENLMDTLKLPNNQRDEARERLQRQRELEHLAWNKLTSRLDITEAYLSQVETGKTLISRRLLNKLLSEVGAQPEEAEAIRLMHKLAALDRMIINTGKTTIQLSKIVVPEWRELVETVQTYYRDKLGTTRSADQVTAEEVQWALYYRLTREINGQVARFLEPVQGGLDFDFAKTFVYELIANAVDSIQAAYGADYRRGRITINVSRSGESIVVKVLDNGQGIKEEFIDDIGTRAFTSAETGKQVDRLRFLGGQGNSLLNVYRAAEERDMVVRAANRPQNAGAEFAVVIPQRLFLVNGNGNGDKALLARVPTELDIKGETYRLAPLSREEFLSNPEYQQLAYRIKRFTSRPLSERRMDDDLSFALLDRNGKPVGYRLLYHYGEDAVHGDDFVVAPELQGTEAAAWLLYHTYYNAILKSEGKIQRAYWKLDFQNAMLEQRASTFYRSIGASVLYEYKGIQNEDRTGSYSLELETGMPLLYARFQRKRAGVAAAAAELLDYQSGVARLYEADVPSGRANGLIRSSIESLERGESLTLAVVPRWDSMDRTLIQAGFAGGVDPYRSFFRSDGAVTQRMVRGVFTAASKRQPAELRLETPVILREGDGPSDLEFNLLILSARYLSGYDSATGQFYPEDALFQGDVRLAVHRDNDTRLYEGTLNEFAILPLRGLESEDNVDRAVLSRQKILEWLDGLTGNRFQWGADLSQHARMWNRQVRRIEDSDALLFGVLPNPVSIGASSFDLKPFKGGAEHAELFGKELHITNFMVRGSFFKRTTRGIPEIAFQTPRNLEFADEKKDVRINLYILAARYLTGYDAESGEFDSTKAVISEDYQLSVLDPVRTVFYRGPIRDFAQRDLIDTTLPPPAADRNRRDSAVLSQPEEVGGIDLTAQRLNIEIRRDETGVVLPLNDQQLQNININGLIPVIINIQPVTNLPLLIGAVESPAGDPVATAPAESVPAPSAPALQMTRAF